MPPSTRRALAWSVGERYLGLMVSIGSTVLLARLLTPAQVGVYSMCAAITVVAGILRDFGVSEYLIQEKDLTREKLRGAYSVAFVIAWSIGIGVYFSRDLVATFYQEPMVAEVLTVLALHFIILPISSPTFALLNREMAFRQVFFLQLASNVTQAATSVSLALLGYGVLSLAWGPIANVVTQSILLIWLRPADSLVLPGLREVRTVLRFGTVFVASRAIEVLTRNFHEPVIAKQLDFASVGLFSRAFGLIEVFHSNVAAAVIRVATPAFADAHRAGSKLARPYAAATAIFVSVSWPFFAFIALVAHPIIEVLFGEQWLPAAPIASALAISALPSGLYALAPQMLSATGHVASRLSITLKYSPVHLIGIIVASQISLVAVAFVWLGSSTFVLALYLRRLRTILDTSIRDLLRPTASSAAVTVGSVAAQAGGVVLAKLGHLTAIPTILLVALLGTAAWIVFAYHLKLPAFAELTNAMRPMWGQVKLQASMLSRWTARLRGAEAVPRDRESLEIACRLHSGPTDQPSGGMTRRVLSELRITCIVVTHNGCQWLPQCLDSLERSELRPHVIVVDNASTDNTVLIARERAATTVIETGANLGFGRANNIGVARALEMGSDYVLLLNQDAHVADNTLPVLCEEAEAHDALGILCPMQITGDSAQLDPTFLEHYVVPYAPSMLGDAMLGRSLRSHYPVAAAPAAAWLIRRQFLLEVGGFDPLFFMYSEDDDLCSRATYHGWGIAIVPAARFFHWRGNYGHGAPERWQKRLRRRTSRLRSVLIRQLKAPRARPLISAWQEFAKLGADGVADLVAHGDWVEATASLLAMAIVVWELPAVIRHRRICLANGPHWIPLQNPVRSMDDSVPPSPTPNSTSCAQ